MSCPADDLFRTFFECPLDDCAFSVGQFDIDCRTIFHFLAVHGHNFLACFIGVQLVVSGRIFFCLMDIFKMSAGRF